MKFKIGDIVQRKNDNTLVYKIICNKNNRYITKLEYDWKTCKAGLIEYWTGLSYIETECICIKRKEHKSFLPDWL